MLSLFHVQLRSVLLARMFSCWLLKQLVDCFIHKLLKFFDAFHSVSLAVNFWQILFIFFIFLITCMIWGWLICHFLLPYFPSTVAWFPCHFTSLWWQAFWTCSCVFGGISSIVLSSVTVSVTSWTFCVVSLLFLFCLLMQRILLLHLAHDFQSCFCVLVYALSYLSYDFSGTLL